MNLSGRYDFKGIKRLGALGLFSLLAGSPLGWMTKGLMGKFMMTVFEFLANYAANKGLIFLNVQVENARVDGQVGEYVRIVDWALKEVKPNMTAEEMKRIDDAVIAKAVDLIMFTRRK